MKLALQIKHKVVFVNGTCVRSSYLASAPLLEQSDKCNAVVLHWILSSLSQDVAELGGHGKLMQFLMGLDDVYQAIRSSILTRGVLPEVKDAFVILAREESHRGIPATTAKSDKPQASVFVSRVNDVKRSNWNANWNNGNTSNNNRGNYNSLLCKNCGLKGHNIERCFEIIGYPPGFKRNPNLKVNGTFNNNKSNNADLKGKSVETNDLKTTAGTLSFTHEQVVKLMNLLNDKSGSTAHAIMAHSSVFSFFNGQNSIKNMNHVVDVTGLNLTVGHPKGTLAKITHISNLRLNNNVIWFDVLVIPEYCDLKRETVLKTGSESTGLYLFDVDCDKIAVSNKILVRLPSSVLNGKTPFSLVYGRQPNRSHLRSFGCLCFAAIVKGSDKFSERSEKCVLIGRDGRAHQPVNGSETEQPGYDGDNSVTHGRVHQLVSDSVTEKPGHDGSSSTTPLDEIDISEGNVGLNEIPVFQNNLPSNTEEGGLRSFVSNLNKGHEPSSYEEAMNDINWVNAMNEEMNALYENKTWDITDLPLNRKPIGCKWVYRIKYKSNGEVERYKARLVAKGPKRLEDLSSGWE
ncbi:ribonuclease H-like domain-containing protein [Tanacetum coccineum]